MWLLRKRKRPSNCGGLSHWRKVPRLREQQRQRICGKDSADIVGDLGANGLGRRVVLNKKKRQRDRAVVVPGEGDPCPRCGVPMQIREYSDLTDKHLHRPYFYTCVCRNPHPFYLADRIA
jgi:hypothetical protein